MIIDGMGNMKGLEIEDTDARMIIDGMGNMKDLEIEVGNLVEAVVNAAIAAYQTQNLEDALSIRDQLNRLPDSLKTDVINDVILKLIDLEPSLCRWFIIDIFLRDADPEAKADVAERINLLIANLQSF